MKLMMGIVSALICLAAGAQDGYEIKVTVKPLKNEYLYLGHYLGKQLPIVDSAKMNEKGEAIFKGSQKLGGGIYLIGLPDKSRNFEILIDKDQKFSITVDTLNLGGAKFANSPLNDQFKAYQAFMNSNGRAMDSLLKYRSTLTGADSIALSKQIDALNTKIKTYRLNILNQDKDGLMALLMRAMREPEVPTNDPAAQTDSLFAYKYFKQHYWDGVNFYDDRLSRTPFFEGRIDKYFDQLVYPSADSVIKELDYMLGFASINADMQKFLLLKFVNRYINQKYMWEDAVFVHLFEKYFANKTYPWLTEKGNKMIADRAYNLMMNITGNPAADIQLPDTKDKMQTLYSIEAPFTLVAIWDPKCGHCKEVIPELDSMWKAEWKTLGLKMFAMAKETDGTKSDWLKFIDEYQLENWTHVYYSKTEENKKIQSGEPGYSQLYDVQTFPTLYLLDKEKRIIGKKLTTEQIDEILTHRSKNQ